MRPCSRVVFAIGVVLLLAAGPGAVFADIYQWEWVDPGDPLKGKRPSATLCPDGAGLETGTGLHAYGRDLAQAYLSDCSLTKSQFTYAILTDSYLRYSDLTGADLRNARLIDADLSNVNLTNANCNDARLAGADFTNAKIRGINLQSTVDSGFTWAQLYSTASYQAGDLSRVDFDFNDLTGWCFAGQNLADASFSGATLTGTDFTNAEIRGAGFYSTTDFGFTPAQLYSTFSYQAGDLTGVCLWRNNLSGWSFTGQNLTEASFRYAILDGVDFANAEIRGANFSRSYAGEGTGMTSAQLQATASYQSKDLMGIILNYSDLTGWDFAGQNLSDAGFQYATLIGTDFTNAEVRGTSFEGTTRSGFTSAQLYSTASYQEGDLSGIALARNDLTGWDFAGKNLTDAIFSDVRLTGTDFTNAEIRGASFYSTGSSFTSAQLYSTASYQVGVLTGVDFGLQNLTAWNFAGQNLTNASFVSATLTGTDFANAEIRGASFQRTTDYGFTSAQFYSTASYRSGDLTGITFSGNDITDWDFVGKDLTDACFHSTRLTGADFTNADIRGADFSMDFMGEGTGITSAQLYSTASYQAGDLSRIVLEMNDLTGWSFSALNLTDADFWSATLNDADVSGSCLTNSDFSYATLANADLSGADARGALFFASTSFSDMVADNLIHPDGHVEGLVVTAGEAMRLWDYSGETPIPILVEDVMVVDSAGVLRAVFEDREWGSTLSFEEGISINLAGTLELLFDDDVSPSSLIGATFQLFDWTGVSPLGSFDSIASQPGLVWDTADLYTTGEVTLLAVPEPGAVWLAVLGLLLSRRR